MARTSLYTSFWVLLTILVKLLIRCNCHFNVNRGPEELHKALFVFGDSLFDPGNNNYINTTTDFQANFWPYGKTFFHFPTGRFSDGRLLPDFIAEYAKLPLIPAYLQPGVDNYIYGVNFASGGAGALVESHQGLVIDLKTQQTYFNKVERTLKHQLGSQKSKALLSRAVYLFSVGGNDYLSPFTSNSSIPKSQYKQYVGMVFGNLTNVIEGIYKKGGRKIGIVKQGPLGCFPAVKLLRPEIPGDCWDDITELANLHNRALPKVLSNLQKQLKGFNYTIIDFNTFFSERLNNPTKYGFKEGKVACCGSGPYRGIYSCGGKRGEEHFELCEDTNEHLFFDSYHLNEKAYEQFAKLVWRGHSDQLTLRLQIENKCARRNGIQNRNLGYSYPGRLFCDRNDQRIGRTRNSAIRSRSRVPGVTAGWGKVGAGDDVVLRSWKEGKGIVITGVSEGV